MSAGNMIDISINEVKSFDYRLIDEIKNLEKKNLGSEASINQWVIPVIIRYGKLIIAQKISDNKIVGVCELVKNWYDMRAAFIHSLYVDREFRSKGIGKKLISEVINILKKENLESVELTVDPENMTVINLYKGFGFILVSLEKDEYGKAVDRYLMRLKL